MVRYASLGHRETTFTTETRQDKTTVISKLATSNMSLITVTEGEEKVKTTILSL